MRRPVLLVGVLLVTLAALAAGERVDAQGDCVVLEDFAKAKVGEFPASWKPRKDEGKDIYTVREESGVRFLHAASKGQGIQAAKEAPWDVNAYPVLVWSWRPLEFPKGADERDSNANDSVLSVYMFVPYSKIRGPRALKYAWSEKVPVGTRVTSNMGLTQERIVRTGIPSKPEWVEERVNVLEDWKRYFNEAEAPKPAGIGVLTDSDDTKSTAQGDYVNFRACRG